MNRRTLIFVLNNKYVFVRFVHVVFFTGKLLLVLLDIYLILFGFLNFLFVVSLVMFQPFHGTPQLPLCQQVVPVQENE